MTVRGLALLLVPFLVLLLAPAACLAHPQPCQVLRRVGHTVRVGALHLQPRALRQQPGARRKTLEREPEWEREWARGAGENELEKSGHEPSARVSRTRGSSQKGAKGRQVFRQVVEVEGVFAPRDSVLFATEALNRVPGLLPYNLSLEIVMAVEAGLGELPAFSFSSSSSSSSSVPVCADPVSFLHSVCHTVIVQGVSAIMAFPQNRDELVKLEFISSSLQIPVVSVVQREFRRYSQVGRPSLRFWILDLSHIQSYKCNI